VRALALLDLQTHQAVDAFAEGGAVKPDGQPSISRRRLGREAEAGSLVDLAGQRRRMVRLERAPGQERAELGPPRVWLACPRDASSDPAAWPTKPGPSSTRENRRDSQTYPWETVKSRLHAALAKLQQMAKTGEIAMEVVDPMNSSDTLDYAPRQLRGPPPATRPTRRFAHDPQLCGQASTGSARSHPTGSSTTRG